MFNKIISISLTLFLSSCCAMRSNTNTVEFTSYPEEAGVVIDGYYCGTTPMEVELNKKANHYVQFFKEGYESHEIILPSTRTYGSFKNMVWPITGALVGTGVGLACYGSGGFIIPQFLIGTAIGTGIGMGVGAIGMGVDCISRSDCALPAKVHGELAPQ